MIAPAQHGTQPNTDSQRRIGSPQPRTKSYRILGYWRNTNSPGECEFLLCMGHTPADAISRLRGIIVDYDPLDRARIDSYVRIEQYTAQGWVYLRSISLKRLKCSIGIAEGHARRRAQIASGQPSIATIDAGRPNFVLR